MKYVALALMFIAISYYGMALPFVVAFLLAYDERLWPQVKYWEAGTR